MSTLAALGACLAVMEATAEDVLITELMADNRDALLDEDGDASDWLELYNPGAAAVNLAGWSLTDDPENLARWVFPAVSIPTRGFLVVFASGKDRVAPAGELHTNFKLAAEGSFLALVDPQENLVSFYTPAYPAQQADVSYGLAQEFTPATLLAEGAPCSALVPTSGTLGTTWTAVGFNAAGWSAGTSGAGYDTGADYDDLIGLDLQTAMMGANASAYLRFPFSVASPAVLDSLTLRVKYDDGLVAYLNGQEVARRNAPATPAWNSRATAEHGEPVTGSMAQDFDAAGTSYVLTAHGAASPPVVRSGGPTGSYLQLMPDATGDLTNTAGFARAFGPADRVVAEFDFRMPVEAGHTGCCGERADGFGFALLDTVEYGASGPGPFGGIAWERPALPDAFAVGFDIFDGTGAENTVSINWNGAEVAAVRVGDFQLNNGVFNRCRVEVNRDGNDSLVSVTLIPNSLAAPGAPAAVFTNHRIRDMGSFDNRVAFGGRTGGAFTSVDLDNIRVTYTVGTPVISHEAIDLSSSLPALRAGANVLAIHGLNIAPGDPDFVIVPVLEVVDFGSAQESTRHYFPQPTPGENNLPGLPGVAPEPQFSHLSRAYTASFSLSLSVASPTAAIRYTRDGTQPTATSTRYTAPLSISATTVVKAKSFEDGLLPSRTVEMHYVLLDSTTRTFSSNLPLLIVNTFGRGIGQDSLTEVSAMIIETSAGRASITAIPEFAGTGGIKIRGSSSTGFPKKNYALEIWDGFREDRDVPLLGMPSESDWILHGPYSDKTLMRNYLSYAWSNDIGRYAVRCRFVEMYLRTAAGSLASGDRIGVYVFMEKIKRGDDRVDLKKLLPSHDAEPEITGGYILKKDRLDPGDTGFTTSRGQLLAFVDPKEEEITPAQRAWIKGYLDQFEAALYGTSFRDPNIGYRRYIDVDSFIDHHILVEVTKNIDGFRLSTFMFKDRGGKLEMGPIWDYNLSLGNADYLQGWMPQGWYYPQLSDGDYPWWRRLFEDPDFIQRYIDRWTELRRVHFATNALLAQIDATATLLGESQARNFQRWPTLGTYVWPNWFIGQTYQEEIDFMKSWTRDRVAWIDSNWLAPPGLNQDGGAIGPGFELTMGAPAGTIYYTLDGSDPRAPGGGVTAAAQQYGSSSQATLVSSAATPEVRVLVPGDGALGGAWTGRSFNDAGWTRGTAGIGVGYENQAGYESYIDVNVGPQMSGINGTVYIRVRFPVADPASFDFLTLRMRYDDGFIAHLNGQQVAAVNAPATPAWNSEASGQHADTAAVLFEDFNLPGAAGLLVAGTNVLAIQGLNAGIGSSDLLFEPELIGTSSTSGDPVPLTPPARLIARASLGTTWSGRKEAVFVQDVPVPLRVTEVMYHPIAPPGPSIFSAGDLEFVELRNVGAAPVSLLGVRFTEGIEFDFTWGNVLGLGPGEYVLVVEDLAAFEWLYGTEGMRVAGQYTGNLENAGESLTVVDGRGQVIQSFAYDDLWYPETDGSGRSLHIIDDGAPVGAWSQAASWAPSVLVDGSPGSGEGEPPPAAGWQLPGDSNQDAALDISDGVSLLLRLFGGGAPAPLPCEGASLGEGGNATVFNLNGDAAVNISDALYLLNYLFRGGPAPAGGAACVRVTGCPNVCVP